MGRQFFQICLLLLCLHGRASGCAVLMAGVDFLSHFQNEQQLHHEPMLESFWGAERVLRLKRLYGWMAEDPAVRLDAMVFQPKNFLRDAKLAIGCSRQELFEIFFQAKLDLNLIDGPFGPAWAREPYAQNVAIQETDDGPFLLVRTSSRDFPSGDRLAAFQTVLFQLSQGRWIERESPGIGVPEFHDGLDYAGILTVRSKLLVK